MSEPWLTVVIPTFNGAAYLPRALQSVCAQHDPGVEMVAVDDGSTDETVSLLRAYARVIPIRTVRTEHSGNWAANSNIGLELARTKYVCFLHQDDFWLPGRLAAVRRLIDEFPKAIMHLHSCWFASDRGARLGLWRCPLPTRSLIPSATLLDRLLVQNFITVSAPVFRWDAVRQVGGLDPQLWYAADWDFWLKLARLGPAVYLPHPLSGFRLHGLSQTVTHSDQLEEIRNQLHAVLARHLVVIDSPSEQYCLLRRVCLFSVAFNLMLFGLAKRRPIDWADMVRKLVELGPSGWRRFLRDSRALERVIARVQLFLQMRDSTLGLCWFRSFRDFPAP